jgi:hypothetical protein
MLGLGFDRRRGIDPRMLGLDPDDPTLAQLFESSAC